MCLGVPGKVIEIQSNTVGVAMGKVDFGGVVKEICLAYVPEVQVNGDLIRSQPLTDELLRSADCVVILTDHSCLDYAAIVNAARLVLDVRNATRSVTSAREKIVRL